MGKYPVIFLSLKSVEGLSYEDARYRITELAGREAQRFSFLSESDKLSDNEKEQYQAIVALHNGKYSMDENILTSSIYILSHLLHRHYGQKTVILIDEYDVPLDKAFQNGYYREMVSLIRGLFGMALKTNDSLQFAVLTGCLRISKESIFTGFNNFEVLSVLNVPYDESFGFTDNEVEKLLDDYTFSATIRKLRSGTMVIISETPICTVRGMLSGIVKACVQIRTQCQKISGRIQAAMPLCVDL